MSKIKWKKPFGKEPRSKRDEKNPLMSIMRRRSIPDCEDIWWWCGCRDKVNSWGGGNSVVSVCEEEVIIGQVLFLLFCVRAICRLSIISSMQPPLFPPILVTGYSLHSLIPKECCSSERLLLKMSWRLERSVAAFQSLWNVINVVVPRVLRVNKLHPTPRLNHRNLYTISKKGMTCSFIMTMGRIFSAQLDRYASCLVTI